MPPIKQKVGYTIVNNVYAPLRGCVEKGRFIMSTVQNKNLLKWAVIFLVPLALLLIPVTDVFTMQHKLFLCITLWTILMFAFGLVDNYIPAIVMPMLFIATGVADWETAYAGLHNPIVWQVLGIFLGRL